MFKRAMTSSLPGFTYVDLLAESAGDSVDQIPDVQSKLSVTSSIKVLLPNSCPKTASAAPYNGIAMQTFTT